MTVMRKDIIEIAMHLQFLVTVRPFEVANFSLHTIHTVHITALSEKKNINEVSEHDVCAETN
jgi:hypothetical protein